MKTDRELLELAAKAAGEDVEWHDTGSYFYRRACNWPAEKGFFNPLHDDAEALRLAVKLRLDIEFIDECDTAYVSNEKADVVVTVAIGDIELRRAIVRAAASIGEAMP